MCVILKIFNMDANKQAKIAAMKRKKNLKLNVRAMDSESIGLEKEEAAGKQSWQH